LPFFVRTWGIGYSLPDKERLNLLFKGADLNALSSQELSVNSLISSYPDEGLSLDALAKMKPKDMNFDAGNYYWGSGFFYMTGITLGLASSSIWFDWYMIKNIILKILKNIKTFI